MKTLRKSTILFMALAVFAMIFTGCKKDSSSSSSNSGGGGGGDVPTGNYGTITLAGQNYTIRVAAYEAYYDEELNTDIVSVVMADGTGQNSNKYMFTLVGFTSIPASRTFTYTMNPIADGSCGGGFQSTNGYMACSEGTLTINGTGRDYTITSTGKATPMGGGGMGTPVNFTISFEGPLVQAD